MDTGGRNAVFLSLGHDLGEDSQAVGSILGDAGVVGQQSDNFPAGVVPDDGEQLVHLVTFTGNGVDDAGLVAELPGLSQNVSAGGVHSDGQVGNFLDAVDHPLQGLDFFAFGNGGAAVDVGGTGICLSHGTGLDKISIALCDCFRYGGNGAVDLFANNNHSCISPLRRLSNHTIGRGESHFCAFHPCLSYQM